MNRLYSIIIFVILFTILSGEDPSWQNIQSLKSPGRDEGRDIAYDSSGNYYVTGRFTDHINLGNNSYYSHGDFDIYLAKYNKLNVLQWVQTFGGTSWDDSYGIDVDSNGNVYVVGYLSSNPIFDGSFNYYANFEDSFIAKLNTMGQYQWIKVFGSQEDDLIYDIKIDSNDNVYTVGGFSDTVTIEGHKINSNGDLDIFAACYGSDGTLNWIKTAGGTGKDYAFALALDEHNGDTDLYVAGVIGSDSYFGGQAVDIFGQIDGFLGKIDSTPFWTNVITFKCLRDDYIKGVCVDDSSNVYVLGSYKNNIKMDAIGISGSVNNYNCYVCKLDPQLNTQWVYNINSNGEDRPGNIRNSENGVIVSGMMGQSANFSPVQGPSNSSQLYVASLSHTGSLNWLKYNTQISQIRNSYYNVFARSLDVSIDGDIIVTGTINGSSNFGSIQVDTELSGSGVSNNDPFWAILRPGKKDNEIDFTMDASYTGELIGNFPNKFNPETRIEFSFAKDTIAEMGIYNIKGQKIKTFESTNFEKGENSVVWDGTDNDSKPCSSGVYFFKLNTGEEVKTQKLLLK